MAAKYQYVINTPIGNYIIGIANNKIIQFTATKASPSQQPAPALVLNIQQQLQQYFNNPDYNFNLPLALTGTAFQKRVWQALSKIPVGATTTYGELAQQLNTSPRAIGNACRQNPITIIIPCHRVVAKNHLGGYGGMTTGKLLNLKKWLLQHETK